MTWPLTVPSDRLRARTSAKWDGRQADVLSLSVAELDVDLSPGVAAALRTAIDLGDTGYAGRPEPLQNAFAGFAERRWGWTVEPSSVAGCPDIATAATEILRAVLAPGDEVIVMTPVYPRFAAWVTAAGGRPVDVPLVDLESGGRLDLPGIRAALLAGARAVMLCHPHNPVGRVHAPDELRALALLADEFDALVLSDEIHAPLTMPAHDFVPYLCVSANARRSGIAFCGASKAWNLSGLKCSLTVAQGDRPRELIDRLAPNFSYGVGHLGAIASAEAFAADAPWLDELTAALADNVRLLQTALAELLPEVTVVAPQAGYLAWLDFRRTAIARDPAARLLESAQVEVSPGSMYGQGFDGFARLNFACSADTLSDAVRRISVAARTSGG